MWEGCIELEGGRKRTPKSFDPLPPSGCMIRALANHGKTENFLTTESLANVLFKRHKEWHVAHAILECIKYCVALKGKRGIFGDPPVSACLRCRESGISTAEA